MWAVRLFLQLAPLLILGPDLPPHYRVAAKDKVARKEKAEVEDEDEDEDTGRRTWMYRERER